MSVSKKNSASGKDGNPRAASTRIGSCTATTLAGQIRHDLRRGPQPSYVDKKRSHLNRVLIQPSTPGQMRKIARERRALRDTQRAMKSNSAIATRGVITFGSKAAQLFEKLTQKQQDQVFREVAEAVAKRLSTSLHGLVVHLDEATIHAHYQLAAYDMDGNPISKTTRPALLSELQDITAEIMARQCPGIERGTRYGDRIAAGADYSETLHKSVKELHRDLPADLERKRQAVADLSANEVDAQARVEEMQARVAKLAEKAELSEKEAKRLATYEKRLADRVAELEAARTESEAARVEADRLADLARADREAEEAKAQKVAARAEAVKVAVAALTEEVGAGTIRKNDEGLLTAKRRDRIEPGFPEVGPAANAAADFVMSMDAVRSTVAADQRQLKNDRAELAQDRQELLSERAEIATLRDQLKAALRTVYDWMKRKETPAIDRTEGAALMNEAAPLVKSAPAKQSRPKAGGGGGLDGPGF